MAGRDFSRYESVIREFENQGHERELICDYIEAWEMKLKQNSNRSVDSLRNVLSKEMKNEKKKVVSEESIRTIPPPSLITTFPAGYPLNDEVVQNQLVKIGVNCINDQYFLESSAKIEINMINHLNIVSDYFKDTYSVSVKNTFEVNEEDFWIIGRIELNDDEDHDEYNLVTENENCQINFQNLEFFTVYPGQIILAKGFMNSNMFNPKQIEINALGDFSIDSALKKKLKIGLISGPFTGPDLDFSHFFSVLNAIKSEINVLILIGPFIDCENEKIKSCNFDIPSLNLKNCAFDEIIKNIFEYLSQIKGIQLIIVPHERELVHLYPLPIPQISRSIPCGLTCAASPAYLNIENLLVHVIPYDIVSEIAENMLIKSNGLVNKAQIALNQLIQQQCYLPIIPNTLPVEYSNFQHFLPSSLPNILIVNTKLSIQNNAVPGMTCIKAIPFVDGPRVGSYTIINASPTPDNLLVGVKNFRANF